MSRLLRAFPYWHELVLLALLAGLLIYALVMFLWLISLFSRLRTLIPVRASSRRRDDEW